MPLGERLAILFDWDGTLVNSVGVKARNAGLLFSQEYGVPFDLAEGAYRRWSGIPRRQWFDEALKGLGLPSLTEAEFTVLSKRFSDMNRFSIGEIRSFPDARSTLDILRKFQVPLYVSSSADTQEVRAVAQALELDGYFCEILGSHQDFNKGIAHAQHVARQQAMPVSALVMVGDEPPDIVLGKAAGMVTIGKVGTYGREHLLALGPDYVIQRLDELPHILRLNLNRA